MKRLSLILATVVASALVGCGDSASTFRVLTAGDSLSDSGTLGYRFTVQGAATAPNRVWTELVASGVGMETPCPRYGLTSASSIALNAAASQCNGYAVAGARINPFGQQDDTTPLSVIQQLSDLTRERKQLGDRDIVLISGGGNDTATVFEYWLGANSPDAATAAGAAAAFQALMVELLGAANVPPMPDSNARAKIGLQYMSALADLFANTVRDQLLANGARRVVIANVPNITQTPRMAGVLATIADPTVRTGVRDFGLALVNTFNNQLATRFQSESRVAVYDLMKSLDAWISDPPPEFTIANTPACPASAPGKYSISTCSAALLSSAEIAGVRPANWWETYLFSDDFHPTPRGHTEAARQVLEIVRGRGWN